MKPSLPTEQKRLFIIDDEASLRDLFSIALQHDGREITTCRDGTSALEILAESRFDLILIDLRMPGASGIEVVRKMRARGDFTRVILCSAFIPERSFIEALQLGITIFVCKPVTLNVLRKTVGNALRDDWQRDFAPALTLAEELNFSEAAKALSEKKSSTHSPACLIWQRMLQALSEDRKLDEILPLARDLIPQALIKA